MVIKNIHTRELNCSISQASCLIDRLASKDEILWPVQYWPPMKLDRPLGVGASGGHGPIGYVVEEYRPGTYLRFRFTRPPEFMGIHAFAMEELSPARVRIRHVIDMEVKGAGWFTWCFAVRWLHDALIEDAFDRAEEYLESRPARQRKWSWLVLLLRWLMSARKR
ncbi:MAG: hypothetical protein JL50_05590 [Peptococcaceae bacterium BICA1-7]|nr:MAG: hypothetical protein JL50_05590 [Peptococcaceae bacterium BICA1-7]HBV96084.1 hypothetical protein [Desulfotomaculum sp.]